MRKIRYETTQKNSFVNFLSVLPKMITQAAQSRHITNLCLETEMIDTIYKRYPNFNKVLTTCHRNPSKAEFQLCYSDFSELFKIFWKEEIVEEYHFNKLDFP